MKFALAFTGCHRRGGIERVMVECANFLVTRGHEVHVYAADWDPTVLAAAIQQHQVPLSAKNGLLRTLRFQRRISRLLPATNSGYEAIGGFGATAPPGSVVWVQSVHRAWIESSKMRQFAARLRQRANPFHPIMLANEARTYGGRRYRKLIALSEQVKSDLMRYYGVPADDIVIIPNGFSPSEFNVQRAAQIRDQVRAELSFAEDDRVVVFVANELERKGFGPLVRALASLNDKRVCLLAVGRLDPRPYTDEIAKLGLTERVRFTGTSSDVAEYYAAADVFALPTQYEAWGLVITEAMASGLPVLTSRLAGAAIAVREGSTGSLLDNPNDPAEIAAKIVPLLKGEHADSEEISASVANYAWPSVLLRYEELLLACVRPTVAGDTSRGR